MALITFFVNDNKTIRDHLIPILEELTTARVVGTAETELEALHWLEKLNGTWEVAVVDLFLRAGSGLGVLRGRGQEAISASCSSLKLTRASAPWRAPASC